MDRSIDPPIDGNNKKMISVFYAKETANVFNKLEM